MTIEIDILGTDYPSPSNAANTNWAATLVALLQALGDGINTVNDNVEALTETPVFTAATLINSWVADGVTPGYYKDPLGFVHLRGSLGTGTSASVAFVLPTGYRPQAQTIIGALAASGMCQLTINTNGNVTLSDVGSSDVQSFVSLASLSFTTAA